MSALLSRYAPPGSAACEIGCGASTWLPVLAARGVKVSGIDYSERGLELSRANLARKGVTAELIHGDVRDPKALPAAQYDVIFSLGFIEHFDDAPIVMRPHRRCAPAWWRHRDGRAELYGHMGTHSTPNRSRALRGAYDLHRALARHYASRGGSHCPGARDAVWRVWTHWSSTTRGRSEGFRHRCGPRSSRRCGLSSSRWRGVWPLSVQGIGRPTRRTSPGFTGPADGITGTR